LRENLHSRVPVYEGSIDVIVGILYTKDLLAYLDGLPADFDLRTQLHPPYFVPESKRADVLLQEFQAKKLHMAIVVDEYGGTAGADRGGRKGRANARGRGGRPPPQARRRRGRGVMLLWVAVFCLAVTMFFSAAEMSFIAANRLRIRHLAEEGNTTAAAYLEAFRRPERTLSTAMMGVTIPHILASSAATFAPLPTL